MQHLLSEKVALITGGTRGIGLALVKNFVAHGAKVVFTYVHSEEKAKLLEKEYKDKNFDVVGIKCDGSKFEEVGAAVEQTIQSFGKIDVLVNNAGITRDNLLLRMTEQQFDEVIGSNLKSVFNFTKHAARYMLRAKQGSIINITSIVGVRGQAGQANYAASKAGMIGFTKSVADEFGSRGIRCNAIAPGFIDTDMTHVLSDEIKQNILKQIPMGRMGTADEVAHAALFLASDLSLYVTGQVLSVCGGMSR
ncbi:MAG: 3-oxoacyl-[acyl-carrier-protein] reductase [Chitinophagales bacterium]|nr:3-oxoacyl-[acyl-carrier-protein] reductase [Chitinophagales bacterium]